MEEMNSMIQAFGEMLEQKLIVVFKEQFDKRLEEKLEEVLDRKLDVKLAPIRDELHSLNNQLTKIEARQTEIEARLTEIEARLTEIEARQTELEDSISAIGETVIQMNLTIENELRPDIRLLAENYVPAAKKYEEESERIIRMDSDITILKHVVAGHGKKLGILVGES